MRQNQNTFNFFDISTWREGDIIVGVHGYSKKKPFHYFAKLGYDIESYYDLVDSQSANPRTHPLEIVVFKIYKINSDVTKIGKSESLSIQGEYLAGPRLLKFHPCGIREYKDDAIIQVIQTPLGHVHLISETINGVICDIEISYAHGFDDKLFDFKRLIGYPNF